MFVSAVCSGLLQKTLDVVTGAASAEVLDIGERLGFPQAPITGGITHVECNEIDHKF